MQNKTKDNNFELKIFIFLQSSRQDETKMFEIDILIASINDLDAVSDFVAEYFHDKEPMEQSHVDKHDKMIPDKNFLLECIKSDTTLLTFVEEKLVAILVAGKAERTEAERNYQLAVHNKSKKSADIFKFLSYIEARADYCNRLNVSYTLQIHSMCVHPDFQGRGIAKELFGFCIDNGRSKKFPAISVDCTNYFTIKIAEQFSMSCLSTLTYDEYNKHIGEELFVPSKPHTVIKSYALSLATY